MMRNWLVVWNMTFIFPYIGNIPTDELTFFRGVAQPPTRKDDKPFVGPLVPHVVVAIPKHPE
jgi:hypothetical protein